MRTDEQIFWVVFYTRATKRERSLPFPLHCRRDAEAAAEAHRRPGEHPQIYTYEHGRFWVWLEWKGRGRWVQCPSYHWPQRIQEYAEFQKCNPS